jgi:hypothetical protein
MQEELAEMFDRRVDLNTIECLSKYFRDEVAREAEVVFEAGYERPNDKATPLAVSRTLPRQSCI